MLDPFCVRCTYQTLMQLPVPSFVGAPVPFSFDDDPRYPYRAREYVTTMLVVVDMCEHSSDLIEYVHTATNKHFAGRLDCFRAEITKTLASINPTKNLIAMRWLMNDFHKIPRWIRDDWVAV